MKKLLFISTMLLLRGLQMSAQNPTVTHNSLSLAVGPNSFYQYPVSILALHTFLSGIGYTVGADYSRDIGHNIYGKLGVRYHTWHSKDRLGPLQWPSENQNGQYVYDPTLDHYIDTKYTDRTWQVSATAGWNSAPGKLQWRTGLEVGVMFFSKGNNAGYEKPRATVGLTGGPEWVINPKMHFFVQPGGQIAFQKTARNGVDQGIFISLQCETGVRYFF